ncbi:hypothetical protein CYMTET_51836, partial [Cymbomonas tetramitiformis]
MPIGFYELLLMQMMVDPNNFNELTMFDTKVTAFFFRKDNVSVDKADAGPGLGPDGPLFCTQDADP